MFVNGSGRNEQSVKRIFHRCFLPSFSSFGPVVSEEKIFKSRPIRNKNCLLRPCLLMDRDEISNLYRGPSIDASYQVSVHLAEGFQRRLKCEKLTDDGRKSSLCLWQGELKILVLRWCTVVCLLGHPIPLIKPNFSCTKIVKYFYISPTQKRPNPLMGSFFTAVRGLLYEGHYCTAKDSSKPSIENYRTPTNPYFLPWWKQEYLVDQHTCISTPTASKPVYIMLTQPSLEANTNNAINAYK